MPSRCRSRIERPLELSHGPEKRKHQLLHGGVLAGERHVLADELHRDPGLGELAHQRPQVVEVAGQPVHRVDHDGVALADVAAQVLQGGAVAGRPGDVVGEHPVQLDAVELPYRCSARRC